MKVFYRIVASISILVLGALFMAFLRSELEFFDNFYVYTIVGGWLTYTPLYFVWRKND